MPTKVRNTPLPQHIHRRGDVYYFVRRIPPDVRELHVGHRFYFSLRTRSETAAIRAANSINQRLESYWMGLRLEKLSIPSLRQPEIVPSEPSEAPLLSEAAQIYVKMRGNGRQKKFFQSTERNLQYALQALGDRPIDTFKPKDAVIFRDRLLARGLTVESAKRSFAGLRAIINFSVRELGLDYRSPFSNALMPNLNDSVRRQPIPLSTIKEVQRTCFENDDDLRWLVAILADTGMRLAECVGLAVTDLKLEGNAPHIDLKPNLWRPLKTPTSARKVPLVGSALWAARRVSETVEEHYAFPRYTDGISCKANSASASLNKWLKSQVPTGCVIHSFRHSLRDRLRAIECPPDIIDAIGGWAVKGIGQRYGTGYPVSVLHKWMQKMEAQ